MRSIGCRHAATVVVGCALLAACMFDAQVALGATVTVGSPLAGSFSTGVIFKEEPGTVTNTSLSDPEANVTSPVSGMVVRWRMRGFLTSDPFKLRILHPVGNGKYMGAGTSAPEVRSSTATETFATKLPIQAGDLIGLDNTIASNAFPVMSSAGSRRAAG